MMNARAKQWLYAGIQALAIVAVCYAVFVGACLRFEDKRLYKIMCSKNLIWLGFSMRVYATADAMEDEQAFQKAGLLLNDTNFITNYVNYKDHWRFTRDKMFPACPNSPRREKQSYDGLRTTNGVLYNDSPVAWERKPYHEGQRHVLFFDGHVELVPEERFHSLTNSIRFTK